MSDGEIVLRGGHVVDGTGAHPRRADVAMVGERIVAVEEGLTGSSELDASGLVIAPGFVDVHTHYDAQVFWDPALTPSSLHGVTTVVAGNCGYSLAPLPEAQAGVMAATLERVEDMSLELLSAEVPWGEFATYAGFHDAVRRRGTGVNFGTYVGHSTVRLAVMGTEAYEREATTAEIEAMALLVRSSLDAGAMGFSTSFAQTHQGWHGLPVPSRHAGREEFLRLAEVVAEAGVGLIEVALGELFALDEYYELQRRLDVPLTYGALVAMEGLWPQMLDLHERRKSEGYDVWPQVTPRPVTMLVQLSNPYPFNNADVFRALIDTPLSTRMAAYRDGAWRDNARAAVEGLMPSPRYDKIIVAESEARPDLIGTTVATLAADTATHPFDAMLDLALSEDLATRFKVILAGDDPVGVRAILGSEQVALSFTDAGAHVGILCDALMQTEVLATWVRDEGVLSLESAVRKMSGELADVWRIPDRGYVRPGGFADLVVFDPAAIGPGPVRRVADFPRGVDRLTADEPTGIAHVFVNGTGVQVDGHRVDGRPGQVIRPRPR